MASYTESNIKSIMSWANAFSRLNADVLDRTSLWGSLEDAEKYAKGDASDPDSRGLQGTSYVGQPIVVFENDVVTEYLIQADRTLKEVGSKEDVVFKVSTFADALAKATEENIGKVIVLDTTDDKYEQGLYIIGGVGSVSKVGISSADGSDYGTLIESLTKRVKALEDTLNESLYWETDKNLVVE